MVYFFTFFTLVLFPFFGIAFFQVPFAYFFAPPPPVLRELRGFFGVFFCGERDLKQPTPAAKASGFVGKRSN